MGCECDLYFFFFSIWHMPLQTPHPMGLANLIWSLRARTQLYSWIVNVNCLPRIFSNRFGGLMSMMQVIPMASTRPMMNDTNMPDQIGAVVNPTQLIAASKRLPVTLGWACEWKTKKKKKKWKRNEKAFNLFMCGASFPCWVESCEPMEATNRLGEKWGKNDLMNLCAAFCQIYVVSRMRENTINKLPKPAFSFAVVFLLLRFYVRQTSSSSSQIGINRAIKYFPENLSHHCVWWARKAAQRNRRNLCFVQ